MGYHISYCITICHVARFKMSVSIVIVVLWGHWRRVGHFCDIKSYQNQIKSYQIISESNHIRIKSYQNQIISESNHIRIKSYQIISESNQIISNQIISYQIISESNHIRIKSYQNQIKSKSLWEVRMTLKWDWKDARMMLGQG
jgi:hypothetical protein